MDMLDIRSHNYVAVGAYPGCIITLSILFFVAMFTGGLYSMREDSFSECVKNAVTGIQPIEINHNTIYQHLTYCIHSLTEYLQLIDFFSACCEEVAANEMIYRGMTNAEFDLRPSLERLKQYGLGTEYELVNEFMLTRPEAFSGLTTSFELMAKMQHYGLPTRLLDFTTNPLIALYFACENAGGDNKYDGRIVCHSAVLTSPNDELVNTICGLPLDRHYVDPAYPVEYFLSPDYSLPRFIHEAMVAEQYPIVAKPKYWNQRIINQSSVFLIYPDVIHDKFGEIAYYTKQYNSFEKARKCEDTPENRKRVEEILRIEKDILSFPDFNLDLERWNRIKKAYSVKYSATPSDFPNPLLTKRFHFGNGLHHVSRETMKEMFVSIIVDKESKTRILKELETIKIDLSFVYPELEYTARQIKRKYEA